MQYHAGSFILIISFTAQCNPLRRVVLLLLLHFTEKEMEAQ